MFDRTIVRLQALTAVLGGVLLAAAGPANATDSPQLFGAPPNAGAAFAMSRFAGRADTGILYASNFYPSSVEVYAAGQQGAPLIGTIANGVSSSYNLAVDPQGTLYVQNNNGTISEFLPGALTPTKILYEQLENGTAVCVTIGPDGTVYASDPLDQRVFAFANGSTSPTYTFVTPSSPLGLAVSKENVLYVSLFSEGKPNNARIEAYPGGKMPGHDIGIALHTVGGLAIDPAGHLLAGDQGTQTIDIFKIGATKPFRQISTAPISPYQFVLNQSSTDLYVAGGQPNGVSVYDYATGKSLGIITEGFASQDYTTGVAIYPAASN